MLSGNKSQKRKRPKSDSEPPIEPDSDTADTVHSTWEQRQAALKMISEFEFELDGGGSVALCARCDPKSSSGSPDESTVAAVKAFQAISGIPVNGRWGAEEERAMRSMLEALESDPVRLECDPLMAYPAPFGCFVDGDAFYLALADDLEPVSSQAPLLSVSGSCESIEPGPLWADALRASCISSALSGSTDSESARAIVDSLLSEHAPQCALLGRDSIGVGAVKFWDDSLNEAMSILESYENSFELLENDAKRLGLL